jgi:two-component system alkaline phosphatase synthesis response regulator PhoP
MSYNVLLIDYDPKSIERIRKLLVSVSAHVVVAHGGRSGLGEYHRSRPDLTIVQDLIPGMHGFDVCREIKKSDDGKDHPVVLLCAPNSHAVLLDTRCDAYLKKPYRDEDLLKLLKGLLPGLEAPGPAAPGSFEAEVDERLDALILSA